MFVSPSFRGKLFPQVQSKIYFPIYFSQTCYSMWYYSLCFDVKEILQVSHVNCVDIIKLFDFLNWITYQISQILNQLSFSCFFIPCYDYIWSLNIVSFTKIFQLVLISICIVAHNYKTIFRTEIFYQKYPSTPWKWCLTGKLISFGHSYISHLSLMNLHNLLNANENTGKVLEKPKCSICQKSKLYYQLNVKFLLNINKLTSTQLKKRWYHT